ncbi:MAG: hypothetical protein Q7J54_00485 [Candidatus Woesearchaeota archaeon]|nr:hypothetical protein [Candidatus Woesearchaeota archaeon]
MSKMESSAYEELIKNNLFLFGIKDLRLLLKINKIKAYNLVKSLKKKKIIIKIGKRLFSFRDVNELVIASNLNFPSYISFWTALNYYGFSDQTPKKIFIATTKYTRDVGNFKYATISKKRFFGYRGLNGVVIAEKEKAIIDSLLFPKYSGGIKEIIKCMKAALNEIDIKKLIDYAFKAGNKAVLRRLGFILEALNVKSRFINKLRKKIGKGYEALDPTLKRKNNLNESWLLDVNT